MFIFTLLWFIIKWWFMLWMYAGLGIGFVVALGVALSIVLFWWELLTEKVNGWKTKQSFKNEKGGPFSLSDHLKKEGIPHMSEFDYEREKRDNR